MDAINCMKMVVMAGLEWNGGHLGFIDCYFRREGLV